MCIALFSCATIASSQQTNHTMHYYTDDSDLDCLRAEEAAERRYKNALARHPDPRDPGHPEPLEGDEEWGDE